MKRGGHELVLIPWHIGNIHDITLNTARAARSIRVFLAEEPEETRRAFTSEFGIDCRGKEFFLIPEQEDPAFLDDVLARLGVEDVGLICSGGVPCFIDPGAWLVRRLRAREYPVRALSGASILSTMLSLSGMDWDVKHSRGTFAFYLHGSSQRDILEAVKRKDEPVFVFLGTGRFRECFAAMESLLGDRLISAFFDLTKRPKSKFPYADRVITMNCRDWLKEEGRIPWKHISDVALMIHPADAPSRRS